MANEKFKCLECGKIIETRRGIGMHVSKMHDLESEENVTWIKRRRFSRKLDPLNQNDGVLVTITVRVPVKTLLKSEIISAELV